ncbi:hypothetical protein HDE68_004847 [Pedobacter cryoconitis]|uniref:Schlafen AlbA-2 domain-containing protein n=1 Tax=Pedobacter cryoconitis TaxID=188932 RepID=A0A7W8ZRK3_9SPHI|nr:ATP-binding protein [Pedobacter cryoconitis]MBB5638909.1 hypothetical protein [Pedobacter cryoconitis]
MNDKLFETLTRSPESSILDFKERCFDFAGNKEHEDAKLVKDILSFSNTIREESAYIIFGIAENQGKIELTGITGFPDDAILQQKVKDKIFPRPKFKSYSYVYQGLTFGVIEIPVHAHTEPLSSPIKMKGIEIGKVYLRQGSSSSDATGREVIEISKWFESLQIKLSSNNILASQLADAIVVLSDRNQALSIGLSLCIGLAIKLNNPDFERFCYLELTGYTEDFDQYGSFADHRIMDVVATPLSIRLNPNFSLSGDALLKHMLTKEHFSEERFFFNKSINEVEGAISFLREKNDKALAAYEIDDKLMYPESDRINGKVTLYMGLSMFNNMYERIRKIALKNLLDMQRSQF